MRRKGLAPEHRTIFRDRCFKTFGVDASLWEFTMFFALLCTPDTRNIAQDISETSSEDVAFIAWHLQWFLDSIGEAIARKSEVLEHGYEQDGKPVGNNSSSQDFWTIPIRAASTMPAKRLSES